MQYDALIASRPGKQVFRVGDKTVKLFGAGYSKSNILNEALNQARVEETGLPIPRIREVTLIEGQWAIVMDYIEGETLETLMRRHPERREEYLDLFLSLQMEIHKKKSPLLTKFRDKLTAKIMRSDLDASARYDLSMRLSDMPNHTHLCHGDFNPSNVILTADGDPYVLDWSHASQGNASADAAKTYLIFRMSGEDELADRYLSLFSERTGTAMPYIRKWLPLVAAGQLVRVHNEHRRMLMEYVDPVG